MKHRLAWLAALLLLLPTVAAGGSATTFTEIYVAQQAGQKVDLCGYYDEGGRVLNLKQAGNKVKGYLAQGSTRCLEAPQMYFEGTLSGIKFTGKMTVCNPEICVQARLMNPTRETDFEFLAFDGGRRLVGSWIYDRIDYREENGRVVSCRDAEKIKRSDFNATRQDSDCASLQLALAERRQMLAWYRQYHVNSTGTVVGPDGREVSGGFNGVQDQLAQKMAGSRAGGSGVRGSIDFWNLEEVISGNRRGHADLCWCKTSCADDPEVDCTASWAQEECQAHESSHCRTMKELCQSRIAGRSSAQARAAWQAYSGDFQAHIADEIAAYEVSISVLEQRLREAGCP